MASKILAVPSLKNSENIFISNKEYATQMLKIRALLINPLFSFEKNKNSMFNYACTDLPFEEQSTLKFSAIMLLVFLVNVLKHRK